MKLNTFLLLLLWVFLTFSEYCHAQAGLSLKYISDLAKSQPKIGIAFSYDSLFLEVTLEDLASKSGVGQSMLTGWAVQTVTSRDAFAWYEAMTGPAISKIKNFNNITFTSHNDELVQGGNYEAKNAKVNALMRKEGVDLLVHVIFGGKFMAQTVENGPSEYDAFFLLGRVNFRFYAIAPGIEYNYLQAPVFDMSYQYGADESRKDWTIEQIQAHMAHEYRAEYAKALARVKTVLETDNYFDANPIGIVRGVEDKKHIRVQTSVPVNPIQGAMSTLETLNNITEGEYGLADSYSFWMPEAPTELSRGLVVAQMQGDNKATPNVVEDGYQLPVARLVVRDGDMSESVCNLRRLPGELEPADLVGMVVITRAQANWQIPNPQVPGDLDGLQIDKGFTADESFLDKPPVAFMPIKEPPVSVKDRDGIARPLADYAGNPSVIPTTSIINDPSNFAVDKVKSVSETVKILQEKGFKVGMVFSPYTSVSSGTGILRFFSETELDQLVKDAEAILGESAEGDNASKLKDMGLISTTLMPLKGRMLESGNDLVKGLNERYQTTIFELIDGQQLPTVQAELPVKSKLLSAMAAMNSPEAQVLDLKTTQYKLLGNYELNVDQAGSKIESRVDLYYPKSAGMEVVGAGFNTTNTNLSFPYSGNTPDADYDKFMARQESTLDSRAEGMWESKATSAFTFSYKDKEMLHPPTTINSSAKANVVPKKEKGLLAKVRRFEADGNKIGIVMEPTAVVAEKSKPQQSQLNPDAAADTIDCVFSAGRVPFSDQYLYLGHKVQERFNEAFETDVFEVIDPDVMPKMMGKSLSSPVVTEVPSGFDTQYKIIVTLSIAGTYSIKKAGASNVAVSRTNSPDGKDGKYEMNMNILSKFRAEEFNNENNKNKNVAGNTFQFVSDRFLTNDCPTGIDDFVAIVGSPADIFPAFDAMLNDNLDKVIKKGMK